MFVARKISRTKWSVEPKMADGEISPDAVTGDLWPRENTLPFCRCNTDVNSDVQEAVLVIALAGDRAAMNYRTSRLTH